MNGKIPLFNPLSRQFSREWLDDNNQSHTLVMEPIAITYFTPPQARFIVKHLTDAVMASRSLNDINNVAERKEIIEQIKVKI